MAFKYRYRHRKRRSTSNSHRVSVPEAEEEPETLEETHEVHEEEEHAVTESPALSMRVPELHHQSSSSTTPLSVPAAAALRNAEDPFGTPSSQHESLGDNVHVVQ
ncbi:hypothetical protein DL93DRAFT_2085456 [Clavulina sp. PMI_390]|nr:hypothetical protein DL93DRAFT_2085456 [Clavulina sp. PMI_390]